MLWGKCLAKGIPRARPGISLYQPRRITQQGLRPKRKCLLLHLQNLNILGKHWDKKGVHTIQAAHAE